MEKEIDLQSYVREVEDFPKEGILFYDVAPLIGNGAVFAAAVHELAEPLRGNVDKIVGFDARGFLFGAAMAHELGIGFAMLRKPGKLPGKVESTAYALEYGNDGLELQSDAVDEGERVALVDDVIATGGTARAGIELVRRRGAHIVEFTALIDLPRLGGSKAIEAEGVPVRTIMSFGGKE
jgi:adenine phosphoribosyltransferase